MDIAGGFTPRELRSLAGLRSPAGIQRALDGMPYHLAATAWPPRRVLRERTAHCLEAAVFAATALRVLGFPPLLLDLEAVQDTDHVIAVYRVEGHWGAVAKSNFSGLRYREPVYRSLRELVMSYFDDYINLRGERTLRAYSAPVDLARFDRTHPGWMTSEPDLWWIAEHLLGVRHTPLLTEAMTRRLVRVDHRALAAGLVGHLDHHGGPRRAPESPRARTRPGEPVARLDSAPGPLAETTVAASLGAARRRPRGDGEAPSARGTR